MINIRIVCTHDAVPFAEQLTRLLGAEQHNVRLSFGRQSLHELEAARELREVVLLVWSYDAPSQHYMLEWARTVDPSRLVEVARAPGAPRLERRSPVIDFANWRGERGARAWVTLNDRLRAVARILEPPKAPSMQAAMALGLVSVAAVGGAIFVRANDALEQPIPVEQQAQIADADDGMGGALDVLEPPSIEDDIIVRSYAVRGVPLESRVETELQELTIVEPLDIRDPTLIERLQSFNPLRIVNNG